MITSEGIARDLLRLIVWYPVRWLTTALPPRAGLKVFRVMGDLHYFASKGKKALLKRNLSLGLPSYGDAESFVRGYFRNHYVNQLIIFILPKLNKKNMGSVHSFEGLPRLDDALKKGKGAILLHSHFGPTHIPLQALVARGYKVMQLGLPTDEGLSFIGRRVAFRLRVRYEGKIQARIVSANSFLRPLLENLKDNGIVLMTGDGAGGNNFIGKVSTEDFLGRKVPFTTGAKAFADKTGAIVLPMFTVTDGDVYKTVIHPALSDDGRMISGFAAIMESYVKKYPHLWHFWDEFDKRLEFTERAERGRIEDTADTTERR